MTRFTSIAFVAFALMLGGGGAALASSETAMTDAKGCPDLPVAHDGICGSPADMAGQDALLITGSVPAENNYLPYTGYGDLDGVTQPVAE